MPVVLHGGTSLDSFSSKSGNGSAASTSGSNASSTTSMSGSNASSTTANTIQIGDTNYLKELSGILAQIRSKSQNPATTTNSNNPSNTSTTSTATISTTSNTTTNTTTNANNTRPTAPMKDKVGDKEDSDSSSIDDKSPPPVVELAPVPKRGALTRMGALQRGTETQSLPSTPTATSKAPATTNKKGRKKETRHSMTGITPIMLAPKYTAKAAPTQIETKQTGMTDEMLPIFEQLTTIVDCHIRMLTMFFERMAVFETNPVLGDIFTQNEELFLKYSVFCALWDKHKPLIVDAAKKNKTTFGHLAKQFESEQMIPLVTCLDDIPKRVPALQTMISDYLKNLGSDEEDYNLFVQLEKQVQQLADEISQRQKRDKGKDKKGESEKKQTAEEKKFSRLSQKFYDEFFGANNQ